MSKNLCPIFIGTGGEPGIEPEKKSPDLLYDIKRKKDKQRVQNQLDS
jgi:hypothetical protein